MLMIPSMITPRPIRPGSRRLADSCRTEHLAAAVAAQCRAPGIESPAADRIERGARSAVGADQHRLSRRRPHCFLHVPARRILGT